MTVHVTIAGDSQKGDPDDVRAKLQSRYDREPAAYTIDVAYLPGRGYFVSGANRMTPQGESARTDRTGPFKMPVSEDVTEEVCAFLRSQGVAVAS